MKKSNKKSQSGIVLVLTLWIVVILSIIAYSFAYEMQLEVQLAKLRKDNMCAYAYARAGLARGIVNLKNDLIFDKLGGIERPCDSNGDIWGKSSEEYKENMLNGTVRIEKKRRRTSRRNEEEDEGFRVRVTDEASKLPLNKAPAILLKYALMELDVEEEDAEFLSHAIVDWRDEDSISESGVSEDENEYYSTETGHSVICKNDPFVTIEEVLEVPGMTPEIFYGTKQDDFYDIGSTEKRRKSKKDEKGVIGFKDMITIWEDKVNINTASKEVLTAIAAVAMVDLERGRDIAETIVDFRDGSDPDDNNDDETFKNVKDLSNVAGVPANIQTIIPLTVFARSFTIESIGYYSDTQKRIIAAVNRNWEKHEDISQLIGLDRNKDADESQNLGEPKIRIFCWKEN